MALPNEAFLRASEKLWKERHTYRQRKVDHYRERESHWYHHWRALVEGRTEDDPHRVAAWKDYDRARMLRVKWERLRNEASAKLAERRKQLERYEGSKPRLITAKQAGLSFVNRWGGKGRIYRGAWHYTASGRARNAAQLVEMAKGFHRYHQSMGWPGLSYEALIADDGPILFANPMSIKSAGVASNNTGLVNICCPGTTGDRLTDAQKASVAWLKANWHTSKVPSRHRLPRPASELAWRGHKEYPGQSTACPGAMLNDYKEAWR